MDDIPHGSIPNNKSIFLKIVSILCYEKGWQTDQRGMFQQIYIFSTISHPLHFRRATK